MHTPSAALSWELWRRHRPRIIAIAGLVFGFALVYPTLCAMVGFNPDSPDALDEIAKKFAVGLSGRPPSALMVIRMLSLLFLACGPAVAMVMSLLFVTWMFTFTEFDPRTKDPMTFPARLFTLPVSTSFLFRWLLFTGMASVVVLYESWIHCVRMPQVEIFAVYQNVLGWLALLGLTQGIVLALAGWPKIRTFLLSGVLFGFLLGPGWRDVYELPYLFPLVLLLGLVLARSGLQKMRHGEWQTWSWQGPFGFSSARAEMRGPQRFASLAQAQLWFEWRRFARPLCFTVAGLVLAPVAIHLLVRGVFGLGPLQDNTMAVFAAYLLAIPAMLHFCFALSPPRADLAFLMNRPLTNGEMMIASMQAAGISTLISWGAVLAALCAMPLLGGFHTVVMSFFVYPQDRAILVLGLMLLTWRLIPSSLGFVLSGHRRLVEMPVWMFLGLCVVWAMLAWLSQVEAYWNAFCRLVPALLMGLIALKSCLAFLAFRVCLKRRLLAPAALAVYLIVWAVLVVALIAALVILLPSSRGGYYTASLAVILLVPLARIGFCPIALAWNRHS